VRRWYRSLGGTKVGGVEGWRGEVRWWVVVVVMRRSGREADR
jgi:hypothetical protein